MYLITIYDWINGACLTRDDQVELNSTCSPCWRNRPLWLQSRRESWVESSRVPHSWSSSGPQSLTVAKHAHHLVFCHSFILFSGGGTLGRCLVSLKLDELWGREREWQWVTRREPVPGDVVGWSQCLCAGAFWKPASWLTWLYSIFFFFFLVTLFEEITGH